MLSGAIRKSEQRDKLPTKERKAMNDEDLEDGLSLMRAANFGADEAARIVIDTNYDRQEGNPVTPDIAAAYAKLEARLSAAIAIH
jgi:hypothetical protein